MAQTRNELIPVWEAASTESPSDLLSAEASPSCVLTWFTMHVGIFGVYLREDQPHWIRIILAGSHLTSTIILKAHLQKTVPLGSCSFNTSLGWKWAQFNPQQGLCASGWLSSDQTGYLYSLRSCTDNSVYWGHFFPWILILYSCFVFCGLMRAMLTLPSFALLVSILLVESLFLPVVIACDICITH